MSGSLAWKLRRLRAMGPAEIATRVQQAAAAQAERLGWGLARPSGPVPPNTLPPWFAGGAKQALPIDDRTGLLAEAEALLAGRWSVFALQDAALGFPPDWHRDPKTGRQAPRQGLGKLINYRDERVVGEIKYLWEINRQLELVTLAQAWRLTGETRWLDGCGALLQSWIGACPYPQGVQWASSLEAAIRLVNQSAAWHLMGAEQNPLFQRPGGAALRQAWLNSVHQHGHFIAGHLSLHSSANNHLLGELMGLVVAACTWDALPDAPRWQALSEPMFIAEALRQTAPDGVNREQALYYQHTVMDYMLIVRQALFAGGRPQAGAMDTRLGAMAEYLVAVRDVAGQVPLWGDADDALTVRWAGAQRADPYSPLLAQLAVALDRADLAQAAGRFDDKCRWLLGPAGEAAFNALANQPTHPQAPALPGPRVFDEGGMAVMGSHWGTPREVKLVLDAAPLGWLSIAAHGHADALALTLSSAGEALLVDPGTYAYHGGGVWRDHFRGTLAHNTLAVDGQDQSESGGGFLWTRHARARLRHWQPTPAHQSFEAEHDGYLALPQPVKHCRRVEWLPAEELLVVTDWLEGQGEHAVSLNWQFGPGIDLVADGGPGFIARGQRSTWQVEGPAGLAAQCLRGQENPPAGWFSDRYDVKHPAWLLRFDGRLAAGQRLVTRFRRSALAAPAHCGSR